MKKLLQFGALLALAVVLFGCTLPTQNATGNTSQEMIATSVAATQAAQADETTGEEIPADAPEGPTLLPHSLYFLTDAGGDTFQVWMVDASGSNPVQITSEPDGIDSFAVSPVDGRVAYITNNQLVVLNHDGVGRSVLVDGSGLIAESDSYYYTQRISGVSWSPDGSLLAYGQDGLHIYSFATSTDSHIIANDINYVDGGGAFPNMLYSPLEWSPDGSQMLVNISFIEGGSLGVYTAATGNVVQLGTGILCCHETWSPDSRSIVIASPYLGMIQSGLWWIDTRTGTVSELIPTTSEDETLNFVGWPLVLPSGELRYFYNNTPDFPEGDTPLIMVQSGSDGVSDRTILRPETWENDDVLWAADGSLVVAVEPDPATASDWPRTGPIVVIPVSEDPVIPLGVNGYGLQWGP